jgi:hypothetical protein
LPYLILTVLTQLAVEAAVDVVNAVSHFRMFEDELYKVHSMSPQNQRELDCVAESLSVQLLKVQKLFDVRWVFSFTTLKAVLRDFYALYNHFTLCANDDSERPLKDKKKYSGLANKLHTRCHL